MATEELKSVHFVTDVLETFLDDLLSVVKSEMLVEVEDDPLQLEIDALSMGAIKLMPQLLLQHFFIVKGENLTIVFDEEDLLEEDLVESDLGLLEQPSINQGGKVLLVAVEESQVHFDDALLEPQVAVQLVLHVQILLVLVEEASELLQLDFLHFALTRQRPLHLLLPLLRKLAQVLLLLLEFVEYQLVVCLSQFNSVHLRLSLGLRQHLEVLVEKDLFLVFSRLFEAHLNSLQVFFFEQKGFPGGLEVVLPRDLSDSNILFIFSVHFA